MKPHATAVPIAPGFLSNNRYPHDLAEAEADLVKKRRGIAQVEENGPRIGLALSGGGIRSATFALGLLQAMARNEVLRRVDVLSTVSGGSYIGSFLGALISRGDFAHSSSARTGIDLAERVLTEPSRVVGWLKENGRYLAPNGAGDLLAGAADAAKSWLTVQMLVFLALMVPLATLAILEYHIQPFATMAAVALQLPAFVVADPFFPFVAILLGIWPAFFLAHWLITDWKHPLMDLALWVVVVFSAVESILRGWHPLLQLEIFSAMAISVIICWDPGDDFKGTFSSQLGLRRDIEYLSQLMLITVVGAVLAGAAWVGRQGMTLELSASSLPWQLAASLAGTLLALGRVLAKYVPPIRSAVGKNLVAAVGTGLWLLAMIIVVSTVAHAVFGHGGARWWYAGLIALVFVIGQQIRMLNGATLFPMYRARLNRAYLGASNPKRVPTDAQKRSVDLTRPLEGDDMLFNHYAPHLQGGPLHLINLTLNETRSGRSSIEQRDRKGLAYCVGPCGLSVSSHSHALWCDPLMPASRLERSLDYAEKVVRRVTHLDAQPTWIHAAGRRQSYHALFPDPKPGDSYHDHPVEGMTLGGWTAISGAAVSTGLGQQTSLVTSLMCTLANLRLGYWWDSHISPWSRQNIADTPMGRALNDASPVFAQLMHEMLARFYGPNRTRWYLTDGGHFENTGAFELIRRRMPFIIISDCGMDPDYTFDDLANLSRKVREDLQAEMRFLTTDELDLVVRPNHPLRELFGIPDAFRPEKKGFPLGGVRHGAHALLAWVFYEGAGAENPVGEDAQRKSGSLVLVIKPSITGDEPVDVLAYRQSLPKFPQQSTAEQFFNEAQWESYRKLGDHVANALFAEGVEPYLAFRQCKSEET